MQEKTSQLLRRSTIYLLYDLYSFSVHHSCPGELLFRQLLLLLLGGGTGFVDDVLFLGENELNVAGRTHVGIDPTVGTVSSPTGFRSAADVNVIDNETIDIELLFARVVLSVLKKVEQVLSTFLGPSTLRCLPRLALSMTSDSAVEPGKSDQIKGLEHLSRVLCIARFCVHRGTHHLFGWSADDPPT